MEPAITDGVVVLRYHRPSDIPVLYAAVDESRTELGRWMDWCHPEYSVEDAAHWVTMQPDMRQAGDHPMVVFSADDGELLGGCGINQVNATHGFANLGYWVRTSATGRGVASRASRLLAIAGLSVMGFGRLEILMEVTNRASQRVAERIGATREGVARDRLRRLDGPRDAFVYSLTAADLPTLVEEATRAGRHQPEVGIAAG